MPLHVRAGAIVPMGPVKQYVDEAVDGPLTVTVYPGANGSFALYEDDGKSFDHRKGAWTRLAMTWNDAARTLAIAPAAGSRPPSPRDLEIRVAGTSISRRLRFEGKPAEITLPS